MENQRCVKGTLVDEAGKDQNGTIFRFKSVKYGKPPFCVVGRGCEHCFPWRHRNLAHFCSTIQSFVFHSCSTHVLNFR